MVGIVLISISIAGWPSSASEVASATSAILRTGWAAAIALLASLAVRPLKRWWPKWARWRRALGLVAFGLSLVHIARVWDSGWARNLWQVLTEPQLRSGATAALILLMMTLTSAPAVVRRLRLGHWRLLHRAVYVAGLLVAHHIALSGHALPWALGLWVAGLLLLFLARVRLRA